MKALVGTLNKDGETRVGDQNSWRCMGCGESRTNLGAKGKGVMRRCARCLAAKAAKKETQK